MSSRPYRPGDTVVFPTLDDSELAALDTLGTRRLVTVGEYLYREGDATYDFYVILSGAVEIVVRSEMEARLCARSPVVVAGGGNSAGQAALFLAATGSPVTVVIRGHDLEASMSRYLVDRIEADARIAVRTNSTISSLDGEWTFASVRVSTENADAVVPCAALLSFIGADPAAGWLSGRAALDEQGFVLTDRSLGEAHLDERWNALGRQPLPFETSYPGLFVVGDVRSGSTKRVAAAVGEGSAAVRSVHEYLAFAH